MIFLVIRNFEKGGRAVREWVAASNQLPIMFGERFDVLTYLNWRGRPLGWALRSVISYSGKLCTKVPSTRENSS